MGLSKIILEGYILVPDDELKLVQNELPNHILLTRQEQGCIVFDVNQSSENINEFSVYEEFTSQAAFDSHQARVKSSRWGRLTSNVERHYQIRTVK